MDMKSVIAKLHPLERAVIPALKTEFSLDGLVNASKLKEIEVMRALQWLENKQLLTIHAETHDIVSLDTNGKRYAREGLPEKRFLAVLGDDFKGLNVVIKKSKLTREEATACIGILRRKKAIEIKKEDGLFIRLCPEGKALLGETTPEEQFLSKQFPLAVNDIQDIKTFEALKGRKGLLKLEKKKIVTIDLTPKGKEITHADLGGEVINRLTAGMLKTGQWKEKTFRAYDVEINVPKKYGGRKHWITQASEYAKGVWMDMGFQEMRGDIIQTSFWNFDALFTAQDHPVREMQDTYFLGGEFEKGKLPLASLVKEIRDVHETGGKTGSTGWQYTWDEEEAKKNVLRTHTTVLTAQNLAKLKEVDLPAKFFALGKNFRNEALDWIHLNEFNQTEGIVVDKNVSFCHLLGYLKQFFTKMGFPQARFRPAFFPYTSPSAEIDVYHPIHHKWVEFGGAGMLRPEVVIPLLGKDIPVLAWGPGFDRIILDYWNITDIRDLYKNDLKQLRESKLFLK